MDAISATMANMFEDAATLIKAAKKIIVIQAENPDGDSLGSALALEELLGDQGKEIALYCPVEIPKYLRYIQGWDRVTADFDFTSDLAIIVDTSADVLLTKPLETAGVRNFLSSHPVLVIDHHTTEGNLSFEHTLLSMPVPASSEIIFQLAQTEGWEISTQAAENLLVAQLSDTLGLSTQSVTPDSYKMAAALTQAGAHVSRIEERRREYMKKSQDILHYKGELLTRIEYALDGKLAMVHIPWEDIQKYSDQYNPSVLVLEEMRLVENVEVAIAFKTYPDGKLTGKLRSNTPVSEAIAGYFGGGGHPYAAGFRVYETIEEITKEVVTATQKVLRETL